jgi:hypothetical protein
MLADDNKKHNGKEMTSSQSSGSADSTSSADASKRTLNITTGAVANLSGTPFGMFQSKKKEGGASSHRMAVFRTHAEERELHHQKECLIDDAIDAVIDRLFAKELKRIAAILSPEYGIVLRKDHATKVERLIVRLEMAVVADPSTLLQNRDQSFVDTRGGGSTDMEIPSESGSGKEASTCSVLLLAAPVNNGEEVLQRVLAQGGSRPNPLVSARGRRSTTSTGTGAVAVTAPQAP